MYLQCTKKMLDKMDKKLELISADDCDDGAAGFYSWHVNYITINRRKAIVCMNNLTRYPVVLYRPKAKDIVQLEKRIRSGIRTALLEEGVPEEIVEEYLQNCGAAEYSKTGGRRMVANLNETCKIVSFYTELLDENSVIQSRISLALGRYIVRFGERSEYPSEEMFRALCRMKKIPEENWKEILEIENYQLKIRLVLEQYDIWRRILIPSRCTFSHLHWVIQKTFDWFDCHLHEFYVTDKEQEAAEGLPLYAYPIKTRIVDGEDPEAEEYLEPDKYEVTYDTQTSLREVFRDTDYCFYTYDFGDNWEHEIMLEKIVKDSHNRFPVLLERKGQRPPEDVGGESGFEEYMRVISDPDSPDHEFMLQWAESAKPRKRSIEEINQMLRYYH